MFIPNSRMSHEKEAETVFPMIFEWKANETIITIKNSLFVQQNPWFFEKQSWKQSSSNNVSHQLSLGWRRCFSPGRVLPNSEPGVLQLEHRVHASYNHTRLYIHTSSYIFWRYKVQQLGWLYNHIRYIRISWYFNIRIQVRLPRLRFSIRGFIGHSVPVELLTLLSLHHLIQDMGSGSLFEVTRRMGYRACYSVGLVGSDIHNLHIFTFCLVDRPQIQVGLNLLNPSGNLRL